MRKKSTRVVTAIHELPTEIIEHHRNVTLEVDIMYINEIPFVVTTSKSIHFHTAELIKNEKTATIATSIKQVLQLYRKRGFDVQCLHGDRQFEHIKKHFTDEAITINITGRNEHVPAIERTIRTMKERVQSMCRKQTDTR